MSTIIDYQKKIENTVQDKDGIITPEERDSILTETVYSYSKHFPRKIVKDFSGDGSAYDFTLPSDYYDEFSVIESVEYPSGEREPVYLESEDWQIYKPSTTVLKLRLLDSTPGAAETVRIIYTTPHIVNSSSATIAVTDQDAVCNLASALYCFALSRYYSRTASTTLTADTVNYQDKASSYESRGNRLLKLYSEHLGIDAGVKAACVITEWDTEFSWKQDYLQHPRKYR